MLKFLSFYIAIILVIFVFIGPSSAHATDIFLSPTGSDSTGTGSIDKPFASLSGAQNSIQPGTRVYFRGGTYHSALSVNVGGSVSAPVTYTSYPGETAIIDGNGLSVVDPLGLITLKSVNYVQLIGFEVANSTGRGISAEKSTNILIQKNKVHDIQYAGIIVSGSNSTVDNNEVYLSAMINKNNAMGGGGWPGAVGTELRGGSTTPLQNISFINNYVHDSWGEGITASSLDGGVVSKNRIKDTFSILLYLDASRNITVDGNYLTAYNPIFYRGGLPARGIEIAAESCCKTNPSFPSENIVISNNLIVHTRAAIRYWIGDYSNPYQNLKIYYNTFKDSISDSILSFDSVATSGNELRNNLIFSSNMLAPAGWVYSNNDWYASTADPFFSNPINDGSADGYKLQSKSPSIGKGLALASVTKDYFGNVRSTLPTIGFYEANDTPLPASTPKPWTTMATDYAAWLSHYLQSAIGFANGDYSENGVVDGIDYMLWVNNYGK